MISHSELLLQFEYCKTSGLFVRKFYRDRYGELVAVNYEIVGKNRKSKGYLRVSINGKRYLIHKLAIFYVTGVYPEDEIDHIDGDSSNNSISNLREVGRKENRKNLKKYITNSSGVTGVHISSSGKFYAQIRHNGINYCSKYFEDMESAIEARSSFSSEFGFHENHGRSTNESQT